MDRTAFIQGLPKAELHLHIEGSLEPAMMLDLAGRNGVELPYADIAEVQAAYQFSNLQDFLDLYYAGMGVLRTASDFFALADACFRRVGADNVTHLECFVDPQAHLCRGVRFQDFMQGLNEAARQAAGRGLEVSLILCFLRHLSEREAFGTLEDAEPYHGDFIGVGLDSSELGHPPRKFRNVFAAARDLGFKLTAHAGEEGPAAYIWEALDVLGVERIDHGNRALEDDALVARLRRDQVPLTLCPLSNLKLRVVPDLRAHPLKRMLDQGLLVTVNSDDPAYFGGYVNDNFTRVAQALNLGQTELAAIAANSFKAAFQATEGPDG
ncbi:MAG: adenosine deaminase [Gammaproteobacteria bacterium]|nr:adenosine deaminase [Gammaproteobacteria bacterium]MYH13697.1 adenosine deaminase [Gammaproteobacteria bacterium]MYK84402.1 adenosine deaminase [Gammaproteobacteria bacterium]